MVIRTTGAVGSSFGLLLTGSPCHPVGGRGRGAGTGSSLLAGRDEGAWPCASPTTPNNTRTEPSVLPRTGISSLGQKRFAHAKHRRSIGRLGKSEHSNWTAGTRRSGRTG